MARNQQTYTEYISKVVRESAEDLKQQAALFGERGDGGAYAMLDRLNTWMDGIRFCYTGESKVYGHLIDKYDQMNDPDYEKYLKLKEKFEKPSQ